MKLKCNYTLEVSHQQDVALIRRVLQEEWLCKRKLIRETKTLAAVVGSCGGGGEKWFMQFPPKNNIQSKLIMQGVWGCGEVLKGRAKPGKSSCLCKVLLENVPWFSNKVIPFESNDTRNTRMQLQQCFLSAFLHLSSHSQVSKAAGNEWPLSKRQLKHDYQGKHVRHDRNACFLDCKITFFNLDLDAAFCLTLLPVATAGSTPYLKLNERWVNVTRGQGIPQMPLSSRSGQCWRGVQWECPPAPASLGLTLSSVGISPLRHES